MSFKTLVIVLLLPISAMSIESMPSGSSSAFELKVLSFSEWKEQQLSLATASIEAAKLDISMNKSKRPAAKIKQESTGPLTRKTVGGDTPDARLARAQLNLEVIKGLDLNDYVMMYLAEQKDVEQVAAAMRQLRSDEIAKLVQTYKLNSERSSSALKEPVSVEASR